MKAQAIVPQKALSTAKSRLGTALSPASRSELSLVLLQGVCAALMAAPDTEDVVVMTPDPAVRAYASRWGVRAVTDPCPGLNAALTQVAASMGTPAPRSHALLIIAADLPLLRPADVAALVTAGHGGAIVLAPSKDAGGTNAMLLPAGVLLEPAYGPGSLVEHRRRAARTGRSVVEVRRPGLAFDLDTEADLRAYGSERRVCARSDY